MLKTPIFKEDNQLSLLLLRILHGATAPHAPAPPTSAVPLTDLAHTPGFRQHLPQPCWFLPWGLCMCHSTAQNILPQRQGTALQTSDQCQISKASPHAPSGMACPPNPNAFFISHPSSLTARAQGRRSVLSDCGCSPDPQHLHLTGSARPASPSQRHQPPAHVHPGRGAASWESGRSRQQAHHSPCNDT